MFELCLDVVSMHPSTHSVRCPFVWTSIHLCIHLTIHLFVYPCCCPSVFPFFIFFSLQSGDCRLETVFKSQLGGLFTHLPFYVFVHLSIQLSICLSIFQLSCRLFQVSYLNCQNYCCTTFIKFSIYSGTKRIWQPPIFQVF